MSPFIASIRVVIASLVVCVVAYVAAVLGVAQLFPARAQGSLIIAADGHVVGSRLIAQNFSKPGYFWPRPSSAGSNGYDASAAAGSNKSPTSAALTARARTLVTRYGASVDRPLPAELAAASGSGLDPHISERAASYQAPRVAAARGLPLKTVEALIAQQAFHPGGPLTPDRLVDVLGLNLALDAVASSPAAPAPQPAPPAS